MTNREAIFHYFPLHAQRILEHIYTYNPPWFLDYFLKKEYNIHFLEIAFVWSRPPEGEAYWRTLSNRHIATYQEPAK